MQESKKAFVHGEKGKRKMAEKEYIERDSAVFALEKALYSYEGETEAKLTG